MPLSDEKIRNPDPGDWPMIRRDYEASNYSPLDEITPQNVASLQLAWVWSMADRDGRDEPAPIAYDGVIYVNNPPNVMQALDGRTGKLIWQTRIASTLNFHPMRGSALAGDKIFVATNQAHLLALDARTGEIVWETVVGERENGDFTASSTPLVINGKVLIGTGTCQQYRPDKCFIGAYDAATGKELWRFRTVALDGEPGGDTWNGLPDLFRAGGDVWITGSYDPGLNLTYWGVAQAKPWMRASRQSGNGDSALHGVHARAEPRHRQARVAFPARAGRDRRSRRSVRARDRRRRGREARDDDRQARHLVEARPRDGQVRRPQRNDPTKRLHLVRSGDGAAEIPARHRGPARRRVDSDLPRHLGRAQLAGGELQPQVAAR